MKTFVIVHGAGDSGWSWHLAAEELRSLGHDVVAPDLPCEDDSAGLQEYLDTVIEAIGARRNLVVVGHSLGGFTAPLVATRLPVDLLVLVAAMVPAPGESAGDWWRNTGYGAAVEEQAAKDGGLTGNDDPNICFYHDLPQALAKDAAARERGQSGTPMLEPWPLETWPDVPTRFVVCTKDRFFPAPFMHRIAAERRGVIPDEIEAGHCVALSQPGALAVLLDRYATEISGER